MALVALAAVAAADDVFTPSARFERWSHFKDVGLRSNASLLERTALADSSCRLLGVAFDGFAFWRHTASVPAVLAVLHAAPATREPSYFTLSVQAALEPACANASRGGEAETPQVYAAADFTATDFTAADFTATDFTAAEVAATDVTATDVTATDVTAAEGTFADVAAAPRVFAAADVAAALHRWHRALCAPRDDPSWRGRFDPAYQPQQEALTSGLLCIALCDAAARPLPAAAMRNLAQPGAPHAARERVCEAFPWEPAKFNFTRATSYEELAALGQPIFQHPCGCGAAGTDVGAIVSYGLGAVAILMALYALWCWWYGKCCGRWCNQDERSDPLNAEYLEQHSVVQSDAD
ncbi:hypothetical protein AB1Y20_013385 [Prymnesium parvum]|uniref:Uncharacterized protein n=1 Tax=Prymnesium parvum TaxID=97485 RepID=A0AB34IH48_PRYPA